MTNNDKLLNMLYDVQDELRMGDESEYPYKDFINECILGIKEVNSIK